MRHTHTHISNRTCSPLWTTSPPTPDRHRLQHTHKITKYKIVDYYYFHSEAPITNYYYFGTVGTIDQAPVVVLLLLLLLLIQVLTNLSTVPGLWNLPLLTGIYTLFSISSFLSFILMHYPIFSSFFCFSGATATADAPVVRDDDDDYRQYQHHRRSNAGTTTSSLHDNLKVKQPKKFWATCNKLFLFFFSR